MSSSEQFQPVTAGSQFYKPIETAKELAKKLAGVSRKIEQAIPTVYEAERQDGYLHTLLTSFQRELLPTLKLKPDNDRDYSFADIYAQTISYGLFTARVFSYTVDERKRQKEQNPRQETFNRQNAWEHLPETNPFLRRLFRDVSWQASAELGEDLADAIAEVFSILRAAKMDAILADFRAKMNREDIVIRFYEDFLAAYKPQMRERRGVYYTPEPVASYMVRSVDILLKEKFDKPLGLADPEVTILDPACGTGTFLLWIFQLIHQRFQENPDALKGLEERSWSGYVKERLLPRIFGFELLMAPYAIAHLKLGLFLEETGYRFDSGKRLGVYLTNTLEEAAQKSELLFGYMAGESDRADATKRDMKMMVVIGNPPYSGQSANKNPWICGLVKDYYKVDGQSLGEANPKWLQDDYVKFIRFGQWCIDRSQKGILAFVTNHSFLDNPTFRGMRQQLISSFSKLHIYDLHGNTKKRERSPDGTQDRNVFDIQQGVSILLAAKGSDRTIKYSDIYGNREQKYDKLTSESISSTNWSLINPRSPFYLLIPQDVKLLEEYNRGWKVTDIMPVNSVGIVTARDSLTINWEKERTWKKTRDFASLGVEEARNKYTLGQDARDWKVALARADLNRAEIVKEKVVPVLYRPFDIRYTYYTGRSRGFHCMPRGEVMRHLLKGDNIALITSRLTKGETFHHAQVSQNIVEVICMSPKTSNNGFVFPLYIYPETEAEKKSGIIRHPNLASAFVKELTKALGCSPTAKSVLGYIYAVLYSPTYRSRYTEFLKIDFPRVPITGDNKLFRKLAAYGEELVALHLMKAPKLDIPTTQFEVYSDRVVDSGHPKYSDGKVSINKRGDGFTGVPEEVWNFYVGGYQVCQKWLKDRKGRTLTREDITHYQRIVVVIQETIHLMQQIDEAIPGFPIE